MIGRAAAGRGRELCVASRERVATCVRIGLATAAARELAAQLVGGDAGLAGRVFEVALEIMDVVEASPRLRNMIGAWGFWRGNPFEAASRREQTTLARGQRVWRMRYALVRPSVTSPA